LAHLPESVVCFRMFEICEVLELGTCEVLKSGICEILELGTCEVLESGICEVLGSVTCEGLRNLGIYRSLDLEATTCDDSRE
jgi:hypothetical protein